MSNLVLDKASRWFGNVVAVNDVSLTIGPGVTGLLGPNGAGKTTAMLLLATLLAPTRGGARIFGHDTVGERAAVRRRLGLVFQETSVDGLLTVEPIPKDAVLIAEPIEIGLAVGCSSGCVDDFAHGRCS